MQPLKCPPMTHSNDPFSPLELTLPCPCARRTGGRPLTLRPLPHPWYATKRTRPLRWGCPLQPNIIVRFPQILRTFIHTLPYSMSPRPNNP